MLHPLVAPFALRQNGDQRETAQSGGASGEGRILSRGHRFFNNARDASRVSRKSRIFWRLQNISGPGTRRETRDSCRSHTHTHRKSERRLRSKENARKEEGKRERESEKEVSRGKVDKRERHQKTLFSVTKDAQ